jgi:translocation and assembly module TamB
MLLLLAISVTAPIALIIAMNTESGRNFATGQINKFAGGQITISGLAGHFPADIKVAHLQIADANGVWLTGDGLELRWRPQDFFSRTIHITALTATSIGVSRAPVAGKSQTSGGGVPALRLDVDRLAVTALSLGASLAGQPVTLAVSGNAHLQNLNHGNIVLDAAAANGQGFYHLAAAIDPQNLNTTLQVSEPPNGLLGHYAGPQVHAPLAIKLTLSGPRDNAALNFTAALGDARLDGAGTLGFDPDAPKANVVFTVPSLAPVAALAGQKISGSTKLHLVVNRQGNATNLALHGDVALAQAPGQAAKLVGPDGQLALLLTLSNNAVEIHSLTINGAGFNLRASGTVTQSGVSLNTHLALGNVATLSPELSGAVAEDGTVIGTAEDFAVNALITGDISEKSLPSGPFSISINAQHLPSLPSGTLTGSGALEGFPLLLDAQFSRDAEGNTNVMINDALWRSLEAHANLSLAAGTSLPEGTAKFSVRRLADFAPFVPVKLSGSLEGDFSHQNAQDFALNVNARNLVAVRSLGPINAKLNAAGPVDALVVNLTAKIARLLGAPANIATAAVVNLTAQSVRFSALTASWKIINAKLLGQASVETKPEIIIHHLALAVNGGRISLDGTVWPKLNARTSVQNLPASLAALAAPTINATGTISATAALTGAIAAPAGNLTLNAQTIKLHTGPAAALPAASLTATAALGKQTAKVTAQLGIGPNVNLAADGLVPMKPGGPISLHLTGTTDLRLLDPILAAAGSTVRGVITPDFSITGTASAPRVNGTVALDGGSVQNLASGLNLTKISARLAAADRLVTLQSLSATAGAGTITSHGTVDLGAAGLPVDLAINADNATPVASDLLTGNLNAALTLTGALRGAMALAGKIDILSANINIPKSLPPSVTNLPILNRGEPPPPPPPPPPAIALDLLLHAHNQIFIRGDGLFAELGGRVQVNGTAANPAPEGGFTLIRGSFAIGGKTLQFTKGIVSFNGDGFIPSLDLEASTTTTTNATASLVIGGTADDPTITLSASPPLPSDEVLSQLLFGQATTSLSPFQAASLAAALASLSGIGGSAVSDPLGSVRNALGLDELSLGGSGSGPPAVQAGRYVAPGVYVGAEQSTTGQGTKATVEINLYKGLKLQTSTGTSGGGSGGSSSVGLTYQFNY